MQYRRVGKTGLKVSEISLGGWLTYGGSVAETTAADIVAAAIDEGINFIDLSDIYSKGEAERVIGNAIRGRTRSDLVISSKVFWPMSDNINDKGLSRKHIMESIDKSLQRLGTDYLDLYFCHRFDPETEVEETVRTMDDLVRQGKILYWGTSVWEADQIDRAVKTADKYLAYRPVVEQPRYNLLDQSIEKAIMPMCARHGIGLVVWSPLSQGILTGKYNNGLPEGSRGATTKWLEHDLNDENLAKVARLATLASDLGLNIAQLALAWVLRRPEVSSAIIGATKTEQLADNVKASGVEISTETLAAIDAIL